MRALDILYSPFSGAVAQEKRVLSCGLHEDRDGYWRSRGLGGHEGDTLIKRHGIDASDTLRHDCLHFGCG